MITQIGIAAGDIWNCLDRKPKVTLTELLADIDRDRELLLMSLGWLAREGHINVKMVDDDYLITLNR
jgi:hypothetical protein